MNTKDKIKNVGHFWNQEQTYFSKTTLFIHSSDLMDKR